MNPRYWHPNRLPRSEWDRIRARVLERDSYTCVSCEHRSRKGMIVHHLVDSADNTIQNLATVCVACHAVLHLGLSLQHGTVEIWESDFTQVELIQLTRDGVEEGHSLELIKESFPLSPGPFPCGSIRYANDLVRSMDATSRISLPLPLCAIFVKFTNWQIAPNTIQLTLPAV